MGSMSRSAAKRFYQYVRMLVSSCYRTLVSSDQFEAILPTVENIERESQTLPTLLSLQTNRPDELTPSYIQENRYFNQADERLFC
jgi:hypothetical protein